MPQRSTCSTPRRSPSTPSTANCRTWPRRSDREPRPPLALDDDSVNGKSPPLGAGHDPGVAEVVPFKHRAPGVDGGFATAENDAHVDVDHAHRVRLIVGAQRRLEQQKTTGGLAGRPDRCEDAARTSGPAAG